MRELWTELHVTYYILTWQIMLDIIIRIPFHPLQNKYPATRFICQNFDKNCILIIKKVQVVDEIKRDICKYLV